MHKPTLPKLLFGGLAIASGIHEVVAQECAAGSAVNYQGNWYCSAVDSISYTNFPGTGHYNEVVHMNTSTGECSLEKHVYSGSLSPLNEELAIHIRGPTWLKQLAIYVPKTALVKRNEEGHLNGLHRHQHGSHHHNYRSIKAHSERKKKFKRAVGDLVSATIDGDVVSWANKYIGADDGNAGSGPHGVGEMVTATINGNVVSWTNEYGGPTGGSTGDTASYTSHAEAPSTNEYADPTGATFKASSTAMSKPQSENTPEPSATVLSKPRIKDVPKAQASSTVPSKPLSTTSTRASSSTTKASAPSGSWGRQAYYNAAQEHAQGLVFLNHYGNVHPFPGWGASLSHASSDGTHGVETAQTLGNAMIPDDSELVILADKSCNDGGCGYTRPDGLAYHGFAGSHKIFLLEFTMPMSHKQGFNADMPAIWLMNAKIALTSQYGENQNCSCWSSGCGELDVVEILSTGDNRGKSTLHMAPAGGSSDYFERPVNGSIKLAVVFYGANEMVVIQVLDDIVTFEDTLTEAFIEQFIADLPPPKKKSVFKLAAAAA